jgi:hypothetical protein
MKKCLLVALLVLSLFLAGCQQQACKRGHSVPHVSITHDKRGTHVNTYSTYVCDEWYPPTDK